VNPSYLFLFDIDCTLLWTQGAGREAMRHAMREVFGTAAELDRHHFGGKTDWQSLVELLGPQGYTSADIQAIMPKYDRAMGRHLARLIGSFDVQACTGAPALVRQLHERQDAHLALVTGNVRSSAPIKLRAAGYDPSWFPVGAYGSEAMERDWLPPMALMRAVDYYGHSFTVDHVVVVGDTPADVQCARALGAVAVAVRTGFCAPGELESSRPDFLLTDLTDFHEVLTGIGVDR
jgi:phosphoglycolate phosphatase-like HAD superfamily hydrolase